MKDQSDRKANQADLICKAQCQTTNSLTDEGYSCLDHLHIFDCFDPFGDMGDVLFIQVDQELWGVK